MKHICRIFLLMAICFPRGLQAANNRQVSYLPAIGIEDEEIVKNGKTVRLSMDIDLSEARIRTQHTVALTPVFISKDGTRELAFESVVIDGRTRNRVYMRAQRLKSLEMPAYHDDKAQAIIRRRNGRKQSYNYTATLPYERWMLDGRVELREEVHGCINCENGTDAADLLTPVLPEFIPNYRTERIAPEPEPVKVRAETRTASLQFRQDSYTILPEYKNNRAELDTVSNSILLVQNNPDVKITGIYITGYASPEGSIAYNQKLSENRAQALLNYIARYQQLDRSLLHVQPCGEDWDGFVKRLDEFPDLQGIDRIREIITQYPDNHDFAELEFRRLIPPTIYGRLLNEVYPPLRRNEYKIEYNVRNFNMEEARKMIHERPDLLSLQEMYKVAGSYKKGSAEYEAVMRVAARYYSDKPVVMNDAALDAMEKGNYNAAISLLTKAPQHPTLLNTLGVAYARAGEPRKAEEAFRKAASIGSKEAQHNLKEVLQVIDQL